MEFVRHHRRSLAGFWGFLLLAGMLVGGLVQPSLAVSAPQAPVSVCVWAADDVPPDCTDSLSTPLWQQLVEIKPIYEELSIENDDLRAPTLLARVRLRHGGNAPSAELCRTDEVYRPPDL